MTMTSKETKFYYNDRNLPESGGGVWKIYGEDPNPDLGGPHTNAYLGNFAGSAKEAMAHAATLAGFFSWGGGGYIQGGYIQLAEAETKLTRAEVTIKNLVALVDRLKQDRLKRDVPSQYVGAADYLDWKTHFEALDEIAQKKKNEKKNELKRQLADIQKKLKELE